MASLGQQKFCATTPRFFKIILEDTSRDHKLKIPKKFVIKYGEDLSNSVILKLPSGSEWQVELTRCNCKTWFGRGWPEFSRFCSLDYGTFIVFRYEGNSKFNVCIFDRTATEIDYPLTMPKIKEVDEDDDNLSIEISKDFLPCPKTREKPPLVCPPLKKMRRSSSGKAISENGNTKPYDTVVFEKPMTNRDSHCSKAEIKKEDDFRAKKDSAGGSSSAERFLRQTPDQQVLEKAIAFQRANAFKSENPSFLVAMLPSYIQSTLSLPLGFSKRHLTKQLDGNIILRVSDGRTWPVEFTCREQKARFQHGWLTFVKDNNLEVGDVCVFILIKDIKLLLRVVFFRTSQAENWFFSPGPVWRNTTQEGNGALSTARRGHKQLTISGGAREFSSHTSLGENDYAPKNDGGRSSSPQRFQKRTRHKNLGRMKQLTTTEKAIALQRANAFKSDNPFFKMAMQPSHIHENKIDLPYEFAKRHLIKLPVGIAILRVSDGDTWSVKFKYDHKNSKARLHNGWSPFVRDNNLKVGDVCVFVLIDRNEFLFEVFFFPTIEAENCSFSPGHGRGASAPVKEKRSPIVKVEAELKMNCEIVKNKMTKASGQVTQKPSSSLRASRINLEAANKFVSENPFFLVTLGSYHKEKSNVSVPASFVKSFIKGGKQILKLQVEDKSWPVNLITYGKHSAKFSGGWAAFATEHCLKEGDVCIFELMEMNEFLLKVHIFTC